MCIVARSLTRYLFGVLPRVRSELRRWERVADAIPDPILRAHAIASLTDKALNVEATAVFAILAPRAQRARVARLMTAYQVMTDYLDTVSELPAHDPLRNGLQLHRALVDALLPVTRPTDYYREHPHGDDGGYLALLVTTCRERFSALPSAATARPAALRAAERCGEGQSFTHAAAQRGTVCFAAWATQQERAAGYEWWELAAGASSSVAVHALLAAATRPQMTFAETLRIDAAYFPPIGALTVLLDDLVDHERDRATASHNYFRYYRSSGVAAERLAAIVRAADDTTCHLQQRRTHAAILAGVAGFYLSAPEADSAFARPIKARILAASGPQVAPILTVMRLRRRLKRGAAAPVAVAPPTRTRRRPRRATRRRRS